MRRRLGVILVLIIVVATAAYVALDWWSGRRVNAKVARLENQYGSLAGLSIGAPRVAAEENSAAFVRAAAALTIHPKDGYAPVIASGVRFEKEPASAAVPPNIKVFVDANQEAIGIVQGARSRHHASWDANYGGGGWNVPRWLDVRTLSDAVWLDALIDRKSGRTEDSARKTMAGLAIAASVRHEPSLIGQLIRIAIATRHYDAVRSLLVDADPSKATLAELARVLAENGETDPMHVGLLGEMALVNGGYSKAERGLGAGDLLLADSRSTAPFWLGRGGRPLVRLARLHYLQQMERLIAIEGGPRPRPPFPDRPSVRKWDWRALSERFVVGLQRAVETGDRHNSALGTTQIAVALRRHRLDRGSYPDDLSALVPTYLPRLPIDPVTGRPPVYARAGAGFTLKAQSVSKDTPPSAALEWSVTR